MQNFSIFIEDLKFCTCQLFFREIISQKQSYFYCRIFDLALHTDDKNVILVFIRFKIKNPLRIRSIISIRCFCFFYCIGARRQICLKNGSSALI